MTDASGRLAGLPRLRKRTVALKLVRTLVEVGGLSIARVREVLDFIRSKDDQVFPALGGVQYALTPTEMCSATMCTWPPRPGWNGSSPRGTG